MTTAPLSNLTATWNAAGTTFSAIKMNVTDTASAAGSLLLDLQVGGTSQFRVSKGGVVSVGSTIELGHASDTTLARGSAGVLTVEGNTVYTSGNLPGTAITWTAVQTFTGAAGGGIVLSGVAPYLTFTETDAAVTSYIVHDGGQFSLRVGSLGDSGLVLTSSLLSTSRTSMEIAGNTVYHAGNLPGTAITWTANQTLSNVDLVLATGAGTKIGTATNQKLGFFNATPVVQPTAVADATDAASVITQLNALLSRMRTLGLIAT